MVPDRDQGVMKALTQAWARIVKEDPRVPAVSFYLTSGRTSSCATASFAEANPVLRINLQHEGKNLTGAEILEWMLHSAAHAASKPTQATEGRWHNVGFRDAAEGLGLAVEKDAAGYGKTSLARGSKTRYADEIAALDRAMRTWYPVAARTESRANRRYSCACDPPRNIRVHQGVADRGAIVCAICGSPFRAA